MCISGGGVDSLISPRVVGVTVCLKAVFKDVKGTEGFLDLLPALSIQSRSDSADLLTVSVRCAGFRPSTEH